MRYVSILITIEEVTLTAIRCLAYFLTIKSRKKNEADNTEMDIPFILNEKMVGSLTMSSSSS